MIAIPVKMNRANSAVSTLFGKAKYFAFIENGKIEILKNELSGGRAVVNWLNSKGVKVLITSHLGKNPFYSLLQYKIDVYFAEDERIIIDEVLNKFEQNELELINLENFDNLFKEDSHSSCSNNNKKNGLFRVKP